MLYLEQAFKFEMCCDKLFQNEELKGQIWKDQLK
jgi:hypothetical protein